MQHDKIITHKAQTVSLLVIQLLCKRLRSTRTDERFYHVFKLSLFSHVFNVLKRFFVFFLFFFFLQCFTSML